MKFREEELMTHVYRGSFGRSVRVIHLTSGQYADAPTKKLAKKRLRKILQAAK